MQVGRDGGWLPSREQKEGMEDKIGVVARQVDSVGKRGRQRLREENRDKIIVFVSSSYGLFHFAEFANPPFPLSRFSTGRSATLWHHPLILISKRQFNTTPR
jgi:hypothetical protein